MKKLMFAAALAAAFACQSYGVESGVVGYNVKGGFETVAGTQGFTLMSLPFKSMKANGNYSLNDLDFSKLTGAMNQNYSDQIWLWVDKGEGTFGYETWRYRNAEKGWISMDGTSTPFDTTHPDGLPPGTAFWFAAYNASDVRTFTGAGQVGAIDREVVINRGEFQFVGCPFPIQLNLNNANQFDSSNCTGAMNQNYSDQIWLWVDKGEGTFGYETWRYRNAEKGWISMDGTSTPFQTKYENGMPVGAGFWFSSYGNGGSATYTITFKTPIAK